MMKYQIIGIEEVIKIGRGVILGFQEDKENNQKEMAGSPFVKVEKIVKDINFNLN